MNRAVEDPQLAGCQPPNADAEGLGVAVGDGASLSIPTATSPVTGVDGLHRDQCDAEVAHPAEQTVQPRLIHRATKGPRPVGFMTEGQTAEQGRPVLAEMPVDPNLVAGG